jgi:hypothetical protein
MHQLAAQSEAETQRVKTEAEVLALRERELAAKAYSAHPALLRLQELETMRELAGTATARLYIGFDKHFPLKAAALCLELQIASMKWVRCSCRLCLRTVGRRSYLAPEAVSGAPWFCETRFWSSKPWVP